MSIDTIGNFLTIIRNGLLVRRRSVIDQCSKLKYEIAQVLKDEGYIKDFRRAGDTKKPTLEVDLKYVNGQSVIHKIERKSRPGRRSYERATGVEQVIGGLGISILTTSQGVMTDRQAKKLGIGGEVICHVW